MKEPKKISKTLLEDSLKTEIEEKLGPESSVDWDKVNNKPAAVGTHISNSAPMDTSMIWIDTSS